MRNIHVVQRYDGFNPQPGWVPVYSANSRKEADAWVADQIKLGNENGWRGLHYRVNTCKYSAR